MEAQQLPLTPDALPDRQLEPTAAQHALTLQTFLPSFLFLDKLVRTRGKRQLSCLALLTVLITVNTVLLKNIVHDACCSKYM